MLTEDPNIVKFEIMSYTVAAVALPQTPNNEHVWSSYLRVPVEFEAPLAGVVDGEGGALGAQVGAHLGAVGRDAGRGAVHRQRVLHRRAQEVPRRLLEREDAAVASAWKNTDFNDVSRVGAEYCMH